MTLVMAEVSRFFSRRFIQIMLGVLVALFAITIYTVMSGSTIPTDEMWRDAEAVARMARDSAAVQHEACLRVNPGAPQACDQFDPARITIEQYLGNVFNFHRRIGSLLMMLATFLGFFGFLVTASFIGSELHSGGMTNLLLWRPNRIAVLGAKFGVATGLVTAISAIFTAIYVATFYAIADTTGLVGPVNDAFWLDIFWLCLRANAIGLLAAVVAFAIATLGRHTAAALGALIGYVVVWEIGARIVADALNSYSPDRETRFLSTYIYTWLNQPYNGQTVNDITWSQSGAVFAVFAVAATAIAFTNFARRDLT